jgi:hypothetical protein
VNRQGGVRLALASTDIARAAATRPEGGAKGERGIGLVVPGRRHRVEHVAREDVLRAHVLDVDDGAGARHGDRFLEAAHTKLGIGRERDAGIELETLPLHRGEPGQRERHGIGSGPQVHELVEALRIRDNTPHLLDQSRARGLDGHTGKHRAGRVAHDPRDTAARLRECRGGADDAGTEDDEGAEQHAHRRTPSLTTRAQTSGH